MPQAKLVPGLRARQDRAEHRAASYIKGSRSKLVSLPKPTLPRK